MLNSVTIPRKLALSFTLICASAAIMMAVLFFSTMSIRDAVDSVSATNSKYNNLLSAEAALISQNDRLMEFMMTGKSVYADEYAKAGKDYDTVTEELRNSLTIENHRQEVGKSREVAQSWRRDWADRMIARVKSGDRDGAMAEFRAAGNGVNIQSALAPLRTVRADQTKFIAERTERQNNAISTSRTALIVGGIALIGISVALAILLSRIIARPISQLTGVMKDLAAGNNDVTVPATDRGDELGDMGKAVLVFRDAAIAKQKADEAAHEAEAVQAMVVDTMSTQLSELASGNLLAGIDTDFPGKYAAIKTNFNGAVAALHEVITSVTNTTESIRSGSTEIASASEDLARRTESNAASLEQTAAAVTQMDDRLKATAAAATRTVARADGTISTVADGRATADEAMHAMERVSESAKGIDNVIEGLDKIAFQTRVLAMNAAVEAGRAGEAGKGFAVVADLVSALAMRAEEEAQAARNQLTATQTDIVAAVEMVRKVDGALSGISSDVGEVHQLLAQMAEDNQTQAGAISEVRVAIDSMDHSTQQNAAMVEQTSAAARQLEQEVGSLSKQAARFRIAETGNSFATTAKSPARSMPVPPPAAQKLAQANGAAADWSSF